MAKRDASELSEGSDVESYPHSSPRVKRPRVNSSSLEEDGHEDPPPIKDGKGKHKMDGDVVQLGEENEAELDALLNTNISSIPNDDDTETEIERLDEASMQDVKRKKEIQKRGIAEKGIIESIEMRQFMCHRYLSLKFGPQVNFIIGNNGSESSGKSAVLSAVMVALGAKSISTGRGNGLKSFIREGESMAEVTIRIKNQGDEPFKPELYGKSIIIIRRFTREGSSSYKIKSANGKIISTKRVDLTAICEHMNIQVDNPMNIMSQDSARQFLSASHPKAKYQFFMKGTQLTQLREEYETCHENIQKTTRTLQLKREETPLLEKAFEEANARDNKASKAREKATQLREYDQEIAWALVKRKEDKMTKKIEEAARANRRLQKLEEAVAKAAADVESAGEEVIRLNSEVDAIPGIDTIVNERDEVNARIKHNRDEIRECKSSETQMDQRIKTLNNEINDLQQRTADEITKRQGNTHEEREEAFRTLQAAKDDRDAKMLELRDFPELLDKLSRDLNHEESRKRDTDVDISKLRQSIEEINSNIQQCQEQRGDDLALFGQNLTEVLSLIRTERWVGETPLGPFGRFVSLKDPKWAPVMRTRLGRSMSSFVITDNRDRNKLRKILDRHRNYRVNIIVSDVDLFDYSRGEPPENITTVLRALNVRHEFIKRILINQNQIEKVLLADERKDCDELLLQLGGPGTAWSADGFIARRYPDGGAHTTPIFPLKHDDPQQHMFAGTDRSADIERLENEKKEIEERLQGTMSAHSLILQHCRDIRAELRRTEVQEKALRTRLNDLESQIIRLDDKVAVSVSNGKDFAEQQKEKLNEEKRGIEKQFEDVEKRKLDLDAENHTLLNQRRNLDQQILEWQTRTNGIKAETETAMQERIEKAGKKKYWDDKLETERANVADLEAAVESLQTEFTKQSEEAEQQFGPQMENTRQPEVIQKQIASIKNALETHERQQGATPEEIAVQLHNAKYALETHKNQIEEISNLNQALKTSLYTRMGRWNLFLTYMVRMCKDQFQYYLWTRGYYGKLFFDHDAETLTLKVRTEDQASTQSQNKDPKSLSGGERSYTTICLLLALWQMIQCPVRCLDEFDVFMDSANRKIAMDLMVKTANSSGKQYILITPQDMSHIPMGPTVKVLRMMDPEDNQTALN